LVQLRQQKARYGGLASFPEVATQKALEGFALPFGWRKRLQGMPNKRMGVL